MRASRNDLSGRLFNRTGEAEVAEASAFPAKPNRRLKQSTCSPLQL
jgi:hypothetical protein